MARVDLEQVVQAAKQQARRNGRGREEELSQLCAQNAQLKNQLAGIECDLVAAKNQNCLLVARLAALEDELERLKSAPAAHPTESALARLWRRLLIPL